MNKPACMSHLARFQVPLPVERITRESLEELATSGDLDEGARDVIRRVLAVHGDGPIESYGLFFGPFAAAGVSLQGYARGARVQIPKGVRISCVQEAPSTSERKRTVHVQHAYAGFINEPYISPAHVVWAGSGGRWCKADLDSILGAGGGLLEADQPERRYA